MAKNTAKTVKAVKIVKKMTETQFNTAKGLRLKTLAAMLGATYIRVYLAANGPKGLGIEGKQVDTGTVGRPPKEITPKQALRIAKHMGLELTFAKERVAAAPVEAPVEAATGFEPVQETSAS